MWPHLPCLSYPTFLTRGKHMGPSHPPVPDYQVMPSGLTKLYMPRRACKRTTYTPAGRLGCWRTLGPSGLRAPRLRARRTLFMGGKSGRASTVEQTHGRKAKAGARASATSKTRWAERWVWHGARGQNMSGQPFNVAWRHLYTLAGYMVCLLGALTAARFCLPASPHDSGILQRLPAMRRRFLLTVTAPGTS